MLFLEGSGGAGSEGEMGRERVGGVTGGHKGEGSHGRAGSSPAGAARHVACALYLREAGENDDRWVPGAPLAHG